ncbi:MAG TPA: NFACT family protein, partial [Candidatus Thermoplasmatota archaeon]|nr:NFACT family protein [Candidatus Thermoplasmatota archaeon]
MTSVDVAALAAELAPLVVGARVERAYQPAKERILLRLRRKGAGKLEMLVEVGRFLTLTRRPPANPDKPSMVAQILRQQLENARVIGFSQVGFDRILRIDMERGDGRSSLVAELFGDGNLLLLDGDGVITLPLRGTDYAARSLRKGERYRPPPGRPPPFGRSLDELRAAGLEAKRDLVRFLSTECGFGPQWAEELCLRAGVAKDRPAAGLGQDEWTAVHGAIAVLGEEIRRADLAPAVVHEGGRAVDAVPFTMQGYPPPRFAHEESATFAEALDALFLGATGDEEGDEQRNDPRRPRFEEAKGKLEFQLRQTDEAIATFEADERRLQVDGDLLYAAFQEAQAALAAIDEARRKAGDWASAEVELARRRAAGDAAAAAVVGLRPHEAAATLRLRDAAG